MRRPELGALGRRLNYAAKSSLHLDGIAVRELAVDDRVDRELDGGAGLAVGLGKRSLTARVVAGRACFVLSLCIADEEHDATRIVERVVAGEADRSAALDVLRNRPELPIGEPFFAWFSLDSTDGGDMQRLIGDDVVPRTTPHKGTTTHFDPRSIRPPEFETLVRSRGWG
jgi:hypothetical protein